MTLWKRPSCDPIRGLTLDRLTRQIEAFESGWLADFALTAEAIEQRDDLLKNVITKRKKAVARHGWEILLTGHSALARQQAAALEFFYRNLTCSHAVRQNQTGGFDLLVYHMMDAVAKGYAVHEILWQPRVVPSPLRVLRASAVKPSFSSALLTAHLKFVPLWYFEAATGRLRFRPSPSAAAGEPLAPRTWLVTVGDALMIACARAFLIKNQPLQAWLDYCTNFGLPGLRGSTGAARGTPEFTAMEDALESFMKELHVVTNSSESLDVIDLKGRGDAPFALLVERMDRAMASLWRGADLSTLSRDRGYGASLQENEARILEEDDARAISSQLNSTLDRWVLDYIFGPASPCLARIKILVTPREATAQDLQIDQFLVAHGARLSIHDALERYGRAPAAPGEPALENQPAAKPNPHRGDARYAESAGNQKTIENHHGVTEITEENASPSLPVLAASLGNVSSPLRTLRLSRPLRNSFLL